VTARGDRSTTVIDSLENDEANRCVDLFTRADGSWGFEEYRRDPEDGGIWRRVAYYGQAVHATRAAALAAAATRVEWLGAAIARRGEV